MKVLTSDHRHSNYNKNFRRSSPTHCTAHSRPVSFPNTPFPAIPLTSGGGESAPSISLIVPDSSALIQDSGANSSRLLGPNCSGDQDQEKFLSTFSRVVNYRFYRFLDSRQNVFLQEALCIHYTKQRVAGLCPSLGNIKKRKPIARLAFGTDLKNTSDDCGVCQSKAVRLLSYLLRDGAREVYEACLLVD